MAIRITGTLLAAPEPTFPLPMPFYGSLMRSFLFWGGFEVLEPETLAQLDRFEGFDPADRQGSLYLREAVPATGLP